MIRMRGLVINVTPVAKNSNGLPPWCAWWESPHEVGDTPERECVGYGDTPSEAVVSLFQGMGDETQHGLGEWEDIQGIVLGKTSRK